LDGSNLKYLHTLTGKGIDIISENPVGVDKFEVVFNPYDYFNQFTQPSGDKAFILGTNSVGQDN
jgi:hypothetical protein